ncbi:hypothetical protein OIU79_021209 [Salix purpurea]|uniref:Bulb-type lectin domain-containing protein n=1 Tax=Salix purpurea TaxID=77065 RepID=A0A9Q0WNX2_SALPP|nr:hypothetical protein OIU79_021209 [Salix purpurea]
MDYISALVLRFSLLLIVETAMAIDTINTTQSIRDGQTLISADGTYVLGYFNPGISKSRYLGIWFGVSVVTPVWVANREAPLNDSSGVLRLTEKGTLVLLNSSGNIIWSTNTSRSPARNPVAQLLDSGNLVVREAGMEQNNRNGLVVDILEVT